VRGLTFIIALFDVWFPDLGVDLSEIIEGE
jgi:hypothetical protein